LNRRILALSSLLLFAASGPPAARADFMQVPKTISAPDPSAVIRYRAGIIAIEHVRVIDGTGAAPRERQTVVIRNGKIAAAGNDGIAVPADATHIDGSGKTLTPGFVGTHDHLYYVSGGPLFIVREQPYSFPRLYLGAGVTTIRTTGSVEPMTDMRIKLETDKGNLVGPHMDVTSPYMTGYEPFFIQMATLHNRTDAKQTVDFWADRGVTSFKLYTNLPPAIAQAVIDEAHKRHARVLAHLCSIGYMDAVRMGVDSLEHGIYIDTEFDPQKRAGECPSSAAEVRESLATLDVGSPRVRALIKAMVAHHVALSSTLANFEGANPVPMAAQQRVLDMLDSESKADVLKSRASVEGGSAQMRALRQKVFQKELEFEVAFYRAGGLLTQGPDPTGYGCTIAGLGDQRDMELLVQGGLTPLEAIRVSTQYGARSLGRESTIGTIAAGKNADLVLIDGNPAADINDIEKVEVVFKDGVGYDSAKIFDSVRGIAGRQ
jgi:imidazolonepropionase-like amidohydrolase